MEEEQTQEQPKYVPRPKRHLIVAWVLAGFMVLGVILQLYWMMNP